MDETRRCAPRNFFGDFVGVFLEETRFPRSELARLDVEDAEGPDRLTVGGADGRAGVETQAPLAQDRVVRETAIARQISPREPCSRVKVNVVLRPGSIFSIVSPSRRVNCPTPQCISPPAPRNSARYRGGAVILSRALSREMPALAIACRH